MVNCVLQKCNLNVHLNMKIKILLPVIFYCFSTVASIAQQEVIDKLLVFYDGEMSIFPSEWLGGKNRIKAKAAKKSFIVEDSLSIERALNYYPPSLLVKHIHKVYILGSLKFQGRQFTGTNSTRNIYIEGGHKFQTEKTFHHEFSSILVRNLSNYSFKDEWLKLSPGLLGGSSADAIKAGYGGIDLDENLMRDGYLCSYALSNWENDFNMYVENLFCGGTVFWQFVDKYPAVKKKVDLLISFYNTKVSHMYSEEFFRELATY